MPVFFLVRWETAEGNYNILGVFQSSDEAYMFAHARRSASPLDIVELVYDGASGGVLRTRIEYL